MPAIALVALMLVVAGLGFRITAVPFHFYAPDVFQGTSLGGAALLSFVPKIAGFVALLRVLGFVLPVLPEGVLPPDGRVGLALSDQVPILLWFLAAVTMLLGNLLALLQDNLKRLLAYSSIAHAGYMLVALAVAPYLRQPGGDASGPDGLEALIYYLVAYGAMTLGAFAVITYLNTRERPVEEVDDLAGLWSSHPGIALLMVLFLFSLIGIPLTAGFTGKFLVLFGAMSVPLEGQATLFRVLAFIGVVNAAIGGWYYLRIIAVMYLRTPLRPLETKRAWPGLATLWICALLTIGLSIPPGADWLLSAARSAVGTKTNHAKVERN
jgi:NADH-quinone oxidoreductase subunit N